MNYEIPIEWKESFSNDYNMDYDYLIKLFNNKDFYNILIININKINKEYDILQKEFNQIMIKSINDYKQFLWDAITTFEENQKKFKDKE